MAKPSFVVNAAPVFIGATPPPPAVATGWDYEMRLTVYTSAGNHLQIHRVASVAADTKAALMQWCRQAAKAIDDAEAAFAAAPKVVSKVAEFVGVRIDATQGGNVELAQADTPASTGLPPAAGG